MKSNAYLNGQDILNWYKTPFEMKFTNKGFPILEPLKSLPIPRRGLRTLPFNYALSNKDKDYFVHFYIQDYLFNRIWNNPQRYIDVLKEYKGIVMPDFSLYTDMPEPLQRFNHYRNLWFARMCQIQGITVIPSPNWSTRDSLEWCLEGMPKNSVIMLSAVGSIKNPNVFDNFIYCAKYAEERLNPSHILIRCPEKSYEKIKSFANTTCLLYDILYNIKRKELIILGGRGSASMKSKSSSGDNMSTGGHLDPMDSKQANSYLESLGISNTKGTIKAIESYTGEGYQKMRSGKDPNSIALIDNYISKSPKFEGTIYRGMSVDSSYISELRNNIGGKISMGVSSSWTSDKGTARSYTRGAGERVIFKMNNKRGASITNLSKYGKAEQEVMHKSNEQYTIVSVRKQGKNTVVTLTDE